MDDAANTKPGMMYVGPKTIQLTRTSIELAFTVGFAFGMMTMLTLLMIGAIAYKLA